MSSRDPATRSPWREPMVWLVWGLPALVVIAGISTVVIAVRAGGSDAVPVEVRRTAQIQVEDLAADRETLRRGLAATLQHDPQTGALQLQVTGSVEPAPAALRLRLRHPGRAELDRELPLARAGQAWHGRLDSGRSHAWNLELAPADGSWRLAGRLEPGDRRAALKPRLAE